MPIGFFRPNQKNGRGKNNLKRIFKKYYALSKETLETGIFCSYSLNQNYCQFPVVFSKEEFVLVEQFYNLLKTEFEKSTLKEWSDFMQSHDYDLEDKCTYSLYSVYSSGLFTQYRYGSKKSLYNEKSS